MGSRFKSVKTCRELKQIDISLQNYSIIYFFYNSYYFPSVVLYYCIIYGMKGRGVIFLIFLQDYFLFFSLCNMQQNVYRGKNISRWENSLSCFLIKLMVNLQYTQVGNKKQKHFKNL